MMVGRVGRDDDSFNCGGGHGLTQYTAVYNGLACDFCQAQIVAGSLAMGCRCGRADLLRGFGRISSRETRRK